MTARTADSLARTEAPGHRLTRRRSQYRLQTSMARQAAVGGRKLEDRLFEVTSEEPLHERYLSLYNRRIRFPAQPGRPAAEYDYDVVGHPRCDFSFAVAFPFHPNAASPGGGEVTLLREHCQGPNEMLFVLPTGGFDAKRHRSRLQCAQAELSEEANLRGGEWQPLLDESHPGIAEVKWCANRFTPYLCIDPQEDTTPAKRDPEEFIEVYRVCIEELRSLMVSGDMMLPSLSTCFLALDRLESLGLLPS